MSDGPKMTRYEKGFLTKIAKQHLCLEGASKHGIFVNTICFGAISFFQKGNTENTINIGVSAERR